MASGDRARFTLGRGMAAVAASAVVLAVVVNPWSWRRGLSIIFAACCLVALALTACLVAADFLMGVRCPACGRWTMARVLIRSFGDRFYRCTHCGVRALRQGWGWEDAASPEFDPIYAKKRPENPWTQPPGVEDGEIVPTKTHTNLLLSKRRRNPNAPDQWTGKPTEPGTSEG